MIIRLEKVEDYFEVENLVRNAFWNVYRPGAYEHYIVHELRNDSSFIKHLAYVIEKDEKIIGHINYSKGRLSFKDESIDAVVLGPVAIDRAYQNRGYGSKLIEFTLKKLEDEDIPFVFVIGDEKFYNRFGFKSASIYNIYLEGTDYDDEFPFFMIKTFEQDFDLKDGIFTNPDVFNVDEKDVDKFDEKFEFRKKEVNDHQLKM